LKSRRMRLDSDMRVYDIDVANDLIQPANGSKQS